MATQKETFQQNLFVRGIGQSKYLSEPNSVADMEGVDVVGEYGVVSLGRLEEDKTAANDVIGDVLVGKDVVGKGVGTAYKKYIFAKNWSYVAQDGSQDRVLVNVSNAPEVHLWHAVTVVEWGYNFYITSKTGNNFAGFDIYFHKTIGAAGTLQSQIETQIGPRSDLQESLRGIHNNPAEVPDDSVSVKSVFLDNSLYIALGNRVYRLQLIIPDGPDVSGPSFGVTEVLRLDDKMGVVRMIPQGDSVYLYTTDQSRVGFNNVDAVNRKNYRYIWQRGTDGWSSRSEIPGTLYDVIPYYDSDIILWDDNVGYFSGKDLVVVKKIPQTKGKVVRPLFRSGAQVGKFITFLTVQMTTESVPDVDDRFYFDDKSGIVLWRFGRERDDNPAMLEQVGRRYAGYTFVDGEMSGNGYRDVFFNNDFGLDFTLVESVSTERSVQYFVWAQKKPDPSTDYALVSFVQPFDLGSTATDYRGSGYVMTQEIGREFNEEKVLGQVGINALVPKYAQVKVSVAVDGSDEFTEVAVFDAGTSNHQWMDVGSKGIVPFYTMQMKVELVSTNGLVSPLLYGVSAEYERRSDVA